MSSPTGSGIFHLVCQITELSLVQLSDILHDVSINHMVFAHAQVVLGASEMTRMIFWKVEVVVHRVTLIEGIIPMFLRR